jgi:hypothetical protein
MANNTTQRHYGQLYNQFTNMPYIEAWLLDPEHPYDMEQNKSNTSFTSCTTPEPKSSSSSAISSTSNGSTNTSNKSHKNLIAELKRFSTKLNQQCEELRTIIQGAPASIYRPNGPKKQAVKEDAKTNINTGTVTKATSSTTTGSTNTSNKSHKRLLAKLNNFRTILDEQAEEIRTTIKSVPASFHRPNSPNPQDAKKDARTKANINIGTEIKKRFKSGFRNSGRAIRRYHRAFQPWAGRPADLDSDDDSESDCSYPFTQHALPNFQAANARGPTHTATTSTDTEISHTFTPVGESINKDFVDGHYSPSTKQETTSEEITS